jgi:hypothetical protein
MHSVKGKRLRRITIGVGNIIVTGLVIDISDILRRPLISMPEALWASRSRIGASGFGKAPIVVYHVR